MMLRAKIAMRPTAPPANMLNMPRMPPLCCGKPGESVRVDAGHRDVGAQTIDHKRTQREPDALLQLRGLGEGREIDVRGKLFRCRCHAFLRLVTLRTAQGGRRVTEATR